MANTKPGNERKFNEVVGLYDKTRPTYVEELYHDLFNYIPINQESMVFLILHTSCIKEPGHLLRKNILNC